MPRFRMTHAVLVLAVFAPVLLGACQDESQSEGAAVLAKTEGCTGPDGGLVLLSSFMGGEYQLVGEEMGGAVLRLAPIWPEITDSYWVYQEMERGEGQAPLQLVHHLTGKDGHYRSTVHRLPDPNRFLHAESVDFDGLGPDQLIEEASCVIPLERESEFLYSGSFSVAECILGMGAGAAATLEMKVTPQAIIYRQNLADGQPVEMVYQKSGI